MEPALISLQSGGRSAALGRKRKEKEDSMFLGAAISFFIAVWLLVHRVIVGVYGGHGGAR